MSDDLDKRAAIASGWAAMVCETSDWTTWTDPCGVNHTKPPSFKTDMNAAMELEAFAFDRGFGLTLLRLLDGQFLAEFANDHLSLDSQVTKNHLHKLPATAITLAFLELHDSGKLKPKAEENDNV